MNDQSVDWSYGIDAIAWRGKPFSPHIGVSCFTDTSIAPRDGLSYYQAGLRACEWMGILRIAFPRIERSGNKIRLLSLTVAGAASDLPNQYQRTDFPFHFSAEKRVKHLTNRARL